MQDIVDVSININNRVKKNRILMYHFKKWPIVFILVDVINLWFVYMQIMCLIKSA